MPRLRIIANSKILQRMVFQEVGLPYRRKVRHLDRRADAGAERIELLG
jgi:hypothetical protein